MGNKPEKRGKPKKVEHAVTTRRVQTGELGRQVCYPLPGYHMTVGKNRIRQHLTQLSLLTLSHSNMISLCQTGF